MFNKFSVISRQRKIDEFRRQMEPTIESRILDVGAEIDFGVQFIDAHPWKQTLSAVNLLPEHVRRIKQRYPEIDARVADARRLPWSDKYFDIVWCNAVIEHVGSFVDQKQMAGEIMRVAKRWFVTTPNRWFPFDFHFRLPLITWLPQRAYLRCGRFLRYEHVTGRYIHGGEPERIRLMTASEMASCFPGSRIIKQRITFMAETLIAAGGDFANRSTGDSHGAHH